MKKTGEDDAKLAFVLPMLKLAAGLTMVYIPTSALAVNETTVSFVAAADVHVSSDAPNINWGSTKELRVGADPVQIAYFKFTVGTPPGATVVDATLRLHADTEVSQSGVLVYAIDDTGWDESSVTYSSRPEVGAQVGSTAGWSNGPGWKEVSLSSLSVDSGPFGLAVEASNSWPQVFSSRESGNGPTLEITYVVESDDPAPNCIGEPADHPVVDYPEKRVFLESQAWWGERMNGDVPQFGDTEHLHIGACFPLQQEVSGVVRMDFRLVAHNVPEGSFIWRTRFHDGGSLEKYADFIYWNREVGANEVDVIEWAENVQANTEVADDGLREARPFTILRRPDDAEIHVSGGWCWNVQNVPGTGDDADPRQFCTNKITQGRGWYDCFEYKNAEVRGWDYPYEGIPSGQSYTVSVSGKDGAGGTGGVTSHFARLNPNFHMDDQGVVLFDHTGAHFNEPLTIGGGVLTPGVHALFLMAQENGTCTGSSSEGVFLGQEGVQDGEISGGIRVPILVNRERVPVDLEVDGSAASPDGNMVLEPGEQVEVAPSWRNEGMSAVVLAGEASDFGGPAGASYTLVADGASYGSLDPGETASCRDTGVCYQMAVSDPGVRPRTHWDATFDEVLTGGSTQTWTLHVGDSFSDVVRTSPFYRAIETMLHHDVTSGCGGTSYCPVATVHRAQMPVFLLRAKEGSGYVPPACASGDELFDDVPASNPLCRWIEELANRGVASGCGGGDYCPSNAVTRAQMAIFLLRTLEGAGYTPPSCAGVFNDVACPSLFADWIEDMYARGIASGCGIAPLQFCPSDVVNRGQMAVFVSNTFGLALYGP